MRRKFPIVALILLAAFAAAAYAGRGLIREALFDAQQPALPEAVSFEEVQPPPFEPPEAEAEPPAPPAPKPEAPKPVDPPPLAAEPGLPAAFNLGVPFTSQAPHGNWDDPYQEFCEEASLYMVHAFYQGVAQGPIDPDRADLRMREIMDFELATFGYHEDTTAAETARIARELYGYARVEVLSDPSVEDIKRHVRVGRPVIVPAAGRALGNPNFTPPGPLYHMLVVRGWTSDGKFITNDPGTRRGEGYLYAYDTLMSANHDWNGGDVARGARVVLVVYPD